MIGLGIFAGLLCAVLQAFSYLFSTHFMLRYRSSPRLLVFSQLAMGLIALPAAILCFPAELLSVWPELLRWLLMWILCLSGGQLAFFSAQREIESSRISSLLGLKILVLSIISVVLFGQNLNMLQWAAVLFCTVAAVMINWSGGRKFMLGGLPWLAMALILYSLTDISETHLVLMPARGALIRNAIGVSSLCYVILAVCTLPMLFKYRWTKKQFIMSIPFGTVWYLSQVALFVSFGYLGTVFANVVQSSRGLISIALGLLLLKAGHERLDAKISGKMWICRIVAALLMMLGIALYSISWDASNR